MLISILLIVAGLAILIFGAEGLVRGSSSIAKRWGISQLVIGLTIIAFGTSAPELIVNLFAAFKGSADLAIGNVVGSNIANILLILGISALIFPICLKSNTIWKEIPFAILAVVLLFIMGNDALFDGNGFNAITRTDGLALMSIFAIFIVYVYNISKNKENAEEEIIQYSWPMSLLMLLGGILGLILGGKLLVDNAIVIAKIAGLSEALIGLTIVAIGTSLPELVTSIVAAYHKHNDMAVGNIIGSNIFNVFFVLGLTGTIIKLPFNISTNIDTYVAIIAVVLLFLFMFIGSKRKIDRWQGALFIGLYIVYIAYLITRG